MVESLDDRRLTFGVILDRNDLIGLPFFFLLFCSLILGVSRSDNEAIVVLNGGLVNPLYKFGLISQRAAAVS